MNTPNDDPIHLLSEMRRDTNPASPEELVETFFDAVGFPPRWRPLMAPLVRAAARDLMRGNVRSIEKRALPGTPGKSVANRQGRGRREVNPVLQRRDALAKTFYTGAKWVSWGKATIEDHENRITFLSVPRDGLNESIQRHLTAINMLKQAKARCLNDLEKVA